MLRRFSLSTRLTLIASILVAVLCGLSLYGLWTLRQQVAEERYGLAKSLVEAVKSQIEYFETQEIIGTLSRAEAQKRALSVIQAARFSGGNYLWVHDMDGNVLAHPLNPELVQQSRTGKLPAAQRALFLRFNQEIGTKDSGIVTYQWPRPEGGSPAEKVSYISHFAPWDWVIGSGVYLGDINAETRRRAWVFLPGILLLSVVAVGLTLRLTLGMTRPLRQVVVAITAIAKGDLDHPLPPESNDEVGDLSRAVNIFCQQQRESRALQLVHQEQQRLTTAVFNTIAEGVIVTDAQGVIKAVNPSFTHLTGYSPQDVMGQTPRMFASGRHGKAFYEDMWASLLAHGQWSGEIWNRSKEGRVFPEWLSIRAIYGSDGRPVEYVAAFSDITQRKQQEERVQWFADHDSLTGLVNRRAFDREVPHVVQSTLQSGQRVAFFFIDLDHFKAVNDTHGHPVGDGLLQAVAQRLRQTVRETDLVARMGGDEFVIVLAPVPDRAAVFRIADTLVSRIAEPVTVGKVTLMPSASIGVLLAPDHAHDSDEALRLADQALYRAKQQGRNQWASLDGRGTVALHLVKNSDDETTENSA